MYYQSVVKSLFSLWGKVRQIFIQFITKKKLKKLKKAEKHENDDNKSKQRWWCWW